jgi:hypothetical protein
MKQPYIKALQRSAKSHGASRIVKQLASESESIESATQHIDYQQVITEQRF